MRRALASVRARAALAATLVVAVALAATAAGVVLALYTSLTGQAEMLAERSAREVAAQLATRRSYDEELSLDDEDTPVQVIAEDGTLVAATEDLERITGTDTTQVTPRPQPSPTRQPPSDDDDDDSDDSDDSDDATALQPGEIDDRTRFTDGSATVDGHAGDYVFARVEVEVEDQGRLTVYAGAPLAAEQSAVRTALTAMLIGFPLLLGVVGGVTWLVTRRALRPVEGIRREMAEITASTDLSRRVPEPDTHDEVARLASTTNETLTALEASVERQRRFVADASHELRSPIASLRTQLEVAAAHPELLDLDGAVEDTVRLQRLATDLLLLARLDAGECPAPDARVDLTALAREEAEGRTEVAVLPSTPLDVPGSRSQLRRVLANLLDNAQRHARSEVTVAVHRTGDWAVVQVADDGEGVPEPDRERIFERFVRLDSARSRDDGGAGLGLAIARDVTTRHGGTLTATRSPAGGALFELRLPLG
ncbi:sensor histidine kinase [Streptomyces sp. NPDC057877]|uniref:sensor histidine kinase n=1 Tax=Streptomyces sp. NPDC057877 TaxID=3346269 RepID=UPI00367FB0B9